MGGVGGMKIQADSKCKTQHKVWEQSRCPQCGSSFSRDFLQGFLFQKTKSVFQLFSGEECAGKHQKLGHRGREWRGGLGRWQLKCLGTVLNSSGFSQKDLRSPLKVLSDQLTGSPFSVWSPGSPPCY